MSTSSPRHLKNEKGFTLVELMIVLVIIGILASMAISHFSSAKVRAYDATVQSNLNFIFKSCKDYWTFNSSYNSCTVATVSAPEYGFNPSSDIKVVIDEGENNTEDDFYATATHTSSSNAFVIDFTGAVSIVSLDTGEGGSDESPEEEKGKKEKGKNKGKGCSEVAQKHLKKIGKKAKGGCKDF